MIQRVGEANATRGMNDLFFCTFLLVYLFIYLKLAHFGISVFSPQILGACTLPSDCSTTLEPLQPLDFSILPHLSIFNLASFRSELSIGEECFRHSLVCRGRGGEMR
jgi:hypothetical protein